jgi:hypothetical protein
MDKFKGITSRKTKEMRGKHYIRKISFGDGR